MSYPIQSYDDQVSSNLPSTLQLHHGWHQADCKVDFHLCYVDYDDVSDAAVDDRKFENLFYNKICVLKSAG